MTSGARFSIIPGDAIDDPELTLTALRLLCYLGRHTNKAGWCRIKQGTIAKDLGIARSTVQLNLDLLYQRGWVEKRHEGWTGVEPDQDGQPFAAHSYRVRIDRPAVATQGEVPDASGTHVPDHASGTTCPNMVGHQERSTSNELERDARAKRESDEPALTEFLRQWPTSAQDGQGKTAAAWDALSVDERRSAIDAVPSFLEDRKRHKRDHTPAGWRYLEERRWSLLPIARKVAPQASAPMAHGWTPELAHRLKLEFGAGAFDTWLAPCQADIGPDIAVFSAPRRLIRDYVAINYAPRLERALNVKVVEVRLAA